MQYARWSIVWVFPIVKSGEEVAVENMSYCRIYVFVCVCVVLKGGLDDVNMFSIEWLKFILSRAHGENVRCGVQWNLLDHVFGEVLQPSGYFLSSKPHKPREKSQRRHQYPYIQSINWKHEKHRHRNELKSNHIHLTTTKKPFMVAWHAVWWFHFFSLGALQEDESKIGMRKRSYIRKKRQQVKMG